MVNVKLLFVCNYYKGKGCCVIIKLFCVFFYCGIKVGIKVVLVIFNMVFSVDMGFIFI